MGPDRSGELSAGPVSEAPDTMDDASEKLATAAVSLLLPHWLPLSQPVLPQLLLTQLLPSQRLLFQRFLRQLFPSQLLPTQLLLRQLFQHQLFVPSCFRPGFIRVLSPVCCFVQAAAVTVINSAYAHRVLV